MAEMTVDLVSVERRLWSGEASFVLARTTAGEIGVLPGHEPTLAQMEEGGVVRIDDPDGSSKTVAVHGGYVFNARGWDLSTIARIDNVFDRRYAGSVIVNEGNGRFFEPAPGRGWVLKVAGSYAL